MVGSKHRNVGVVGLGIIGSRVAECLRRVGHHVFVWNRSARAEPNFLASPREVAEVANFIQVFVRDSEALLTVMREMQPALTKTHVVCAHSTVSVSAMKEAALIADDVGAGFLDAPFTGSRTAAEKGELVYYVSGDLVEQEKALPLLQASSKKVLTFGTQVGDATVLKIATNLVSGGVVVALAEALALAQAHGVEGAQLLEAFQNNANCSPLITMKLPAMMSSSYAAHFSLKNMLKDARYAQELAQEQGLVTPVLDAAVNAMAQADVVGQSEMDYSVVFENFRKHRDAEAPRPRPKTKPLITLKASKFSLAEDDEPEAMSPPKTRRP